MAYCTIAKVQGHNPKRTYGASTTPTTTQVTEFINRISDEIDVVLAGRGLTVPVTTPTVLVDYLSQVNALGAAALAEDAMFPESQTPGTTPHGQSLWAKYQEALKFLRSGNLPVEVEGEMVGGYYTDVADQNDYPDPVFRIRPSDKEF